MKFSAGIIFMACLAAMETTASVEKRSESEGNVEMKIAKTSNNFMFDLYRSIRSTKPNHVFSSYSIATALSAVYLGAKSSTADGLSQALQYGDLSSNINVHHGHNSLLKELKKSSSDETFLELAVAIFLANSVGLKPKYKNDVQTYYNSTVEKVDFSLGSEVKDKVNAWCDDSTRHQIKEILKEPPEPDTVMLLLSAVYFQGSWKTPFNADNTRTEPFYNNGDKNQAKDVLMMHDNDIYPTYQNYELKLSALSLPYKGDRFSMIFLLPDETSTLQNMESILDHSMLQNIIDNLSKERTELAIPKFILETEYSLKQPLTTMGAGDMFAPGIADFSGMFSDKNVMVDDVIHAAKIEVDEVGVKASGVTLVKFVPYSMPSRFAANRPFMFFIYDVTTRLVLFMGRVSQL